MHARLHAFAALVLDEVPGPLPHAHSPPYGSIDELLADLDIVVDSLAAHGAGALADAHVVPVRQAVATFGAHLCALDSRQNSAVHEAVIAELLARRRRGRLPGARRAAADRRCSRPSCHSARPLRSPGRRTARRTRAELDVLDAIAEAVAATDHGS